MEYWGFRDSNDTEPLKHEHRRLWSGRKGTFLMLDHVVFG